MGAAKSKIICPVNPLVIRGVFSVPAEFNQLPKEFNEESLIQLFRESIVEKKQIVFMFVSNQTYLCKIKLSQWKRVCLMRKRSLLYPL